MKMCKSRQSYNKKKTSVKFSGEYFERVTLMTIIFAYALLVII